MAWLTGLLLAGLPWKLLAVMFGPFALIWGRDPTAGTVTVALAAQARSLRAGLARWL
jgi:hypothetical protein